MDEDPIEITFLVITVLERLGIKYLIGGSLASFRTAMARRNWYLQSKPRTVRRQLYEADR